MTAMNVFIYMWVVGRPAGLVIVSPPMPPAAGLRIRLRGNSRSFRRGPARRALVAFRSVGALRGVAPFVRPDVIALVGSSRPPPESDQRRAWGSCYGLPRGGLAATTFVVPAQLPEM